MGLWPTHRDESALLRFIDSKRLTPRLSTEFTWACGPPNGDESALLRFIDSKQVTRVFRGSVTAILR